MWLLNGLAGIIARRINIYLGGGIIVTSKPIRDRCVGRCFIRGRFRILSTSQPSRGSRFGTLDSVYNFCILFAQGLGVIPIVRGLFAAFRLLLAAQVSLRLRGCSGNTLLYLLNTPVARRIKVFVGIIVVIVC